MIEEISLGAKLLGFAKKYWLYIAIAIAVAAAFAGGLHWYHGQIAAAEKRGEEREAQHVLAAVQKIQTNAAKVTAKIRSKNDEKMRAISRDADDLRLRGPGKAVCPYAAPAAPVRRDGAGVAGNAPVGPVSDPERPELIALPFSVLLDFAEDHDRLRAKVQSTIEQHDKLQAAQPALPQKQEQPR
jgi:hypothetical protein